MILAKVRIISSVTSKLQLILPKSLADRYGIRPGDEIQWESAGDVIRVVPSRPVSAVPDITMRLRVFDQATARQQRRQEDVEAPVAQSRGWTREELYDNGGPD